MSQPTVFISYSHKDEIWKDRLRPHLGVLEQQGQIIIWDDRQIDAGSEWFGEIKKVMDEAAVSICLISSDYLSSDFCVKEEIPYLLERRKNDGMTLIPVLVRACAWKAVSWLKPLQMLPHDGKNVANDFKDNWDEVFAGVAEFIFEIVDANKSPKVLTRGGAGKRTKATRGQLTPTQPPQFVPPKKTDLKLLPVTGSELEQQIGAMAPAIRYFLREAYGLNDELAKDLTQDVIVAAIEAVRKPGFELKSDVKLATFVHSIVRHKALDFLGARSRRPIDVEDIKFRIVVESGSEPTEANIEKIKKWIDRLGEPQSQIIHLIYYQGLKVADVAKKLNIAARQVSMFKFMALRQLHEWSDEHERFLDSVKRLPVTGEELFGRDNDLQQLDEIWESQNVNVISLVAWGGVGKSALVNKWLERLGADNYRGARRVYGWSFYSQGTGERVTSADQFIAAALEWFGDPDPTKGSPWDKGERLAELVRQQKTLLILDGMEPLQSNLAFEHGNIKDPGLAVLVAELARKNNGLCVITTREPVADLQEAGAGAMQKNLEQISAQAGRALLRVGGVQGTDAELEKATADFGNHALAINLLAAYLHDIPGHHISHSREIPDLDIPEEKGKHPRRVMAAFEQRWGESPAVQVLRILGLFDRPAELAAVDAVRRPQVIVGLTDQLQNLTEGEWLEVLENLRQHKLLAPRSRHNLDTLDCHPLVREHFGEKLKAGNAASWKEAHSRLYEFFKAVPKKEFPDTLEEMGPLYAAVGHGCQAERYQEALNQVYVWRILRRDEHFSWRKFGLFNADLAALSGFFDVPWLQPVANLGEADKKFVLHQAALYMRALGRLTEAAQSYQAALEASTVIEDWTNANITAGDLGELYLILGDLPRALKYAQQSVDLADRSGDTWKQIARRMSLAYLLHQVGNISSAEATFHKAEHIHSMRPFRYALWAFKYCDLLLAQGKYQEVKDHPFETVEWTGQDDQIFPLEIALEHLCLGEAHLLQLIIERTDEFTQAEARLNQAADELQQAGRRDHLPLALLARAELYRVKKDFAKAQRDLDEAFKIATRGGMRLHEADCHLEYARLHLAMGEKDKTRESWAKAKKMIEEMGYHRRDPEIFMIEAQLHLSSGEKDKARESLAKAKELIDKMGMHRWDFEVKEIEEQLSKL